MRGWGERGYGGCLGDVGSVLPLLIHLWGFCDDRGYFFKGCCDLVDEGERDCAFEWRIKVEVIG